MNSINQIAAELATATRLVRPEILMRVRAVADCLHIPFGRVLVMHGHLGEGDLTALLTAASLIERHELSFVDASSCLIAAVQECLPLENVIARFNAAKGKLSRLLLNSQIVSEKLLIQLIKEAGLRGLTLGETLIQYRIIGVQELQDAIEALVLVRGKCITEDHADIAISIIHSSKCSLAEALEQLAVPLAVVTPRLGDLLIGAGVLTAHQVTVAAEMGIESDIPIGEVLFKLGLLPPLVLKTALRLQSMILSSRLTFPQAQELLRQTNEHKVPVEKVLQELGELTWAVLDLLRRSRAIADDTHHNAVEIYESLHDYASRASYLAKVIDMPTLRLAIHCVILTRNKTINASQAEQVFRHCRKNNVTVSETMREITMIMPVINDGKPAAAPLSIAAA